MLSSNQGQNAFVEANFRLASRPNIHSLTSPTTRIMANSRFGLAAACLLLLLAGAAVEASGHSLRLHLARFRRDKGLIR